MSFHFYSEVGDSASFRGSISRLISYHCFTRISLKISWQTTYNQPLQWHMDQNSVTPNLLSLDVTDSGCHHSWSTTCAKIWRCMAQKLLLERNHRRNAGNWVLWGTGVFLFHKKGEHWGMMRQSSWLAELSPQIEGSSRCALCKERALEAAEGYEKQGFEGEDLRKNPVVLWRTLLHTFTLHLMTCAPNWIYISKLEIPQVDGVPGSWNYIISKLYHILYTIRMCNVWQLYCIMQCPLTSSSLHDVLFFKRKLDLPEK